MVEESQNSLKRLVDMAVAYEDERVTVIEAKASASEGYDGEPLVKMLLLLEDPSGETWDVESIQALRISLSQEAVANGLPRVSLTLVAESEREEMSRSAG